MSGEPEHVNGHGAPQANGLISTQPASIPPALSARHQWVGVRLGEPRKDGKRPKIPYDVRTDRKASVTSPTTWAPFPVVLKAYQHGQYDGIGFVLTKKQGIVGVDLDGCRDNQTGEIDAWAAEVVAATQ